MRFTQRAQSEVRKGSDTFSSSTPVNRAQIYNPASGRADVNLQSKIKSMVHSAVKPTATDLRLFFPQQSKVRSRAYFQDYAFVP